MEPCNANGWRGVIDNYVPTKGERSERTYESRFWPHGASEASAAKIGRAGITFKVLTIVSPRVYNARHEPRGEFVGAGFAYDLSPWHMSDRSN